MVPKASKGPSTLNILQVSERERQQESSEQKTFYQLFSQDQISDSYDFKLHFPDSSDGKASAYNVGDPGSIPGSGRSPEKEIATHSSIHAWKIPWTQEPGSEFTFTNKL